MMYILTERETAAAEQTLKGAATSGHWQAAPLALIAEAIREATDSQRVPGSGWMVTEPSSDGPVTSPVLYFEGGMAYTPDMTGWVDEAVPHSVVWHPAMSINGEPMTEAKAVEILRASQEVAA